MKYMKIVLFSCLIFLGTSLMAMDTKKSFEKAFDAIAYGSITETVIYLPDDYVIENQMSTYDVGFIAVGGKKYIGACLRHVAMDQYTKILFDMQGDQQDFDACAFDSDDLEQPESVHVVNEFAVSYQEDEGDFLVKHLKKQKLYAYAYDPKEEYGWRDFFTQKRELCGEKYYQSPKKYGEDYFILSECKSDGSKVPCTAYTYEPLMLALECALPSDDMTSEDYVQARRGSMSSVLRIGLYAVQKEHHIKLLRVLGAMYSEHTRTPLCFDSGTKTLVSGIHPINTDQLIALSLTRFGNVPLGVVALKCQNNFYDVDIFCKK